MALPERFVALVFDDIHLKMEDATFVRTARKNWCESMTPADRIGIFGTSEAVDAGIHERQGSLEQTLRAGITAAQDG